MSYGFFAGCYDALTENVQYRERADYICSLLSQNGINGGLLLDLACGTGTLSILLAQKGFSVIGVDSSEDMLAEAQNKMYENGQSILFLCQDMRSLDLYGTVDCAVCTLDSLNHLQNIEEIRKTFAGVSLFMNTGGIFIFDVNTLYKHREVLGNHAYIYDCGATFCAWQNTLEADRASVRIDLDFFEEQENGAYARYSESFTETAYTLTEIESALNDCGFSVLGKYKELTTEAPDNKTERVVFVAKKGN